MKDKLWLNKKDFDDIFFLVHGAFLGRITDSMHSCYIANKIENELVLIIFFKDLDSRGKVHT